MKKLAASLITLLVVALANIAHATPIQWTLTGVTLSDQTTLSGSFFYDAATNKYSNWSLSVQQGVLDAFTYNSGDSSINGMSGTTRLFVLDFDYERYINLGFATALSDAGGTINLLLSPGAYSGSWECNNCDDKRWVTAGAVTAATRSATEVPEPSTLALIGAALTGLGLSRRKRA